MPHRPRGKLGNRRRLRNRRVRALDIACSILLSRCMSEIDKFFDDPSLFINRIDLRENSVEFIKAARADIAAESFLDDHPQRTRGIWENRVNAPLAELLAAAARRDLPAPHGFIFPTAMCGSTLVARCLEAPGVSFAIKEPQAIGDLANARRLGETKNLSREQWNELVRFVGSMLSKAAPPGEKTIIKISNKINVMAGDLCRAFPEAKALLLYSDLQPFMLSMLKRGQPSWEYCRNLLKMLFLDAGGANRQTLWGALDYTDLQIAPLVWHLQFDALSKFQQQAPLNKVKSLDCENFFQQPKETLSKIAGFFDVSLSDSEMNAIVRREVYGRHAKDASRAFNPEARTAEHSAAKKQFARELEFVDAFCRNVRPDITGPRRLANPL